MDSKHIFDLAARLDSATLEKREIERLTLTVPNLSLAEAYSIQEKGMTFRFQRGEKPVGFKMGLTSQAKREQMNLDSAIYGVLTDKMQILEGSSFSVGSSIHPKIEPEIAFWIGRDLSGNVSAEEALAACSGVTAALEILDSRFLNFKYFSLPDVVADNCSSAYFVMGQTVKKLTAVSLSELEMTLKVNGKPVQKAYSNAISGNPLQSVVQLCEMLHQRGQILPAGSLVLAGAATQAVPLERNTEIQLEVDHLGSVTLSITE